MHALSTAGLARHCKPRAPWRGAGECIATVPIRCGFAATFQSAPRTLHESVFAPLRCCVLASRPIHIPVRRPGSGTPRQRYSRSSPDVAVAKRWVRGAQQAAPEHAKRHPGAYSAARLHPRIDRGPDSLLLNRCGLAGPTRSCDQSTPEPGASPHSRSASRRGRGVAVRGRKWLRDGSGPRGGSSGWLARSRVRGRSGALALW